MGKPWEKPWFGQPIAIKHGLVGGCNPSEKYESQLGLLFPIYGKIKHVPNHQPVVLLMAKGLLLLFLF